MKAIGKMKGSWHVLVSVLIFSGAMVVQAKECRAAYPTIETCRIHFAFGVMEDGSRTQVFMSPNQENTIQFQEKEYVHMDVAVGGSAFSFLYYYRQGGYKPKSVIRKWNGINL